MKKLSLKLILIGYLVTMSKTAFCLPIIDSLVIAPENPTSSDFITAEIEGTFPTSGFTIPIDPVVTISDSQIDTDIFFLSPTGIVLPVLTPFMLTADIGVLQSGNYEATAFLFVDYVLSDTLSTSFNVSEPAIWLLIMPFLILLFTINKERLNSLTNKSVDSEPIKLRSCVA